MISASRTPALRPCDDADRRSAPAASAGGRRPTCVVYTTDKDLGQARLEQIYHPAIMAARRALVAASGDLAILDLAAGGEPDLDELRTIGAELAGLVIVYEVSRAPLKIMRALSEAETVGFDARDPQWRHKLTSRVSEAVEAVVAKRARRQQTQPASPRPNREAGGGAADVFLDHAPVAASLGAFLGCLTTLDLTALGFLPCLSSAAAAVLLCGHLFVTRTKDLFSAAFFPALYGGTFAGMTPVLWLSAGASGHSALLTGALFVSLSVLCGLAFFVVAHLDVRRTAPVGGGFGGRSGAIATVASFLFIQAAGLLGADAGRFHGIGAGAFAVEPWAALGFAACLAGNVATLLALRQTRLRSAGMADRIFAAAVVALVGLTALQLFHPGDVHLLEAFYAGCFLGMSTPERTKGWLQPVLGALVLTAVLIPLRAVLPGVGGCLGLAAFATVAMLVASSRVLSATRDLLGFTRNAGGRAAPAAARNSVGSGDQYLVTTGA
jgi:hypothetical protein